MRATIMKWLMIITSGGCLLQAGCPSGDEIKSILVGSVEGLANDVVGLMVESVFSSITGA